jgi:hypothetical protein
MALLLFATGCGSSQPEETTRSLVVYTSQDRVYAEPIFNQFTKATGIEIKAQFDSESAKTMGLAKRILAEQTHPVCDLFWSNESLAVRKLAEAGAVQSRFVRERPRFAEGSDTPKMEWKSGHGLPLVWHNGHPHAGSARRMGSRCLGAMVPKNDRE